MRVNWQKKMAQTSTIFGCNNLDFFFEVTMISFKLAKSYIYVYGRTIDKCRGGPRMIKRWDICPSLSIWRESADIEILTMLTLQSTRTTPITRTSASSGDNAQVTWAPVAGSCAARPTIFTPNFQVSLIGPCFCTWVGDNGEVAGL